MGINRVKRKVRKNLVKDKKRLQSIKLLTKKPIIRHLEEFQTKKKKEEI